MQVLSSLSGFPIYAPSAAYAPTNGADVSAIASAYADPKLDATASGQFQPSGEYLSATESSNYYPTSNPSGFVTGVDLSDYATTAYVDSSVSGKMDTAEMSAYLPFSAISADENSAITSINGSSVGGNEITAAHRVVTYDPGLDVSSTSTATGTATGFGVIDQVNAVAFDTASHVYKVKLNDNTALRIAASQLVAGTWQTGGMGNATYPYYWLSFSPSNNAFPASATTGYLSPCQWATGAGIMLSAGYFRGMLKANELFLSRESVLDASTTTSFKGWYIRSECHNSRGAHIGFTASYGSGGAYTGTGDTVFNTATSDINVSSVTFSHTKFKTSASKARVTTGGFTASSTNTTASSTAYMGLNRSSLWFSANDTSETGTGSSYAYYGLSGITFEDSASTSTLEPSSIPYWNAKQDASDMSGYIPTSESANYYSTSNPSGFLTAHQSLAGYATEAYVDSSVSSKLDTTAFSTVSGDFLTSHQSLAGYATESYVDSAVSGKLDVTASSQFLTSLPDDLAYTSDVASAVSGKLDASASSDFYPMTGNPSGFLTAHQSLAGYATETYVDGAVSGKLDATAYDSAEFYLTSNPSGFITGVDLSDYATTAYVDSSVSGKQDSSAMTAYVAKSAYDDLYSAFTALSDVISTYSGLFSSISAKVDNSAIGVIE